MSQYIIYGNCVMKLMTGTMNLCISKREKKADIY